MGVLSGLAAFLSLPLVLGAFTWYAVRARRTGSGQSLMAPLEEIWDPISHRTNIEVHAEAQRTPETPSPGDPALTAALDRPRSPRRSARRRARRP